MKSAEELEWERMSKKHSGEHRGQRIRFVVAIAVAAVLAVGSFLVSVELWDGQHQAREDLRRDGIYGDSAKEDASDAKSFPVLFVLLPAIVGTAAFAITFRVIGGKMPDAYKRVLGG